MNGGTGTTDEELGDLHGGEETFDGGWDADFEGGEGVVGVHESMDGGVEEDEDKDWRGHEPNTCPHAHHGSGVVISLQGAALPPFCQNNRSINNLIKLAEIEQPSVKRQTLFPQSTPRSNSRA